ncbi:hypothetical protein ACIQXI_00820 [Lysinibacillus sp. NPDC097195]|uniref:hypothetical protein n=1 Tax=Lysinibacillus sp. NPDC097195 TaxID=3364141 RepID=UPI003815480A
MARIQKWDWWANKAKYIYYFIRTLIDWVKYKVDKSKKNDFLSVVFTFIPIIMITFVLYYFVSQIKVPNWLIGNSIVLKSFFGFNHIDDHIVKNMIFTIISSLTIIISLLSAIYVFTYREQKSVSPSASTDKFKNKLLLRVIKLMIFNIIFGSLVNGAYNWFLDNDIKHTLDITKLLLLRVITLFLSLIFLIYYIIVLVKYLFRTMSLDSMLVDSVKHSNILCDSLINMNRFKLFKLLIKDRYRIFHFSIESVFQNLKFVADNNMNKEFEENINEFKEVFNKFKNPFKETSEGIVIHVSTELLKNEEKEFIKLYQSAIRSNLALISSLFKNQQYNKATKAVELYFNMYIETDETLTKIFRISLNDLLDILDTKEEKQIKIFLDGLKEVPEEQTLTAYRNLLMKLVSNNQLKNITNVVYDFNVVKKFNKKSLLTILIQNLVKSIEISNYQITGFLVKYLITNNTGKEINMGLIRLKKNKFLFTTILEAGEKIEGVSENIVYSSKINEETYDYCIKKAFILLYAQHMYSIKEKLWYAKDRNEIGTEINITDEFIDDEYKEYMIKKIEEASSKYGLNFFNDKEIMKVIYKALRINYSQEKVKSEILLTDILEQLILKLFSK